MLKETLPRIDLTGHRFGKMTVLEFAGYRPRKHDPSKKQAAWIVLCDCGTRKEVLAKTLKGGTVSCGCARRKHGHSAGPRKTPVSPTYRSWRSMLARCLDTSHVHYKTYGGAGVKVCERWNNFENFLEDMGVRPKGKTLDRIDPAGGYERENCRWATYTQQARNRKNNRVVTFNGQTKFAVDWARELGLSPHAVWDRHIKGLPIDKRQPSSKRILIHHAGETDSASGWAVRLNTDAGTVLKRWRNGWPIDQPMPWGTSRKSD